MVMLFECQMCDPPEEWLGKSAPPDFRMSAPQQGWCICKKHVEKLDEEPFEKKHRAYNNEEGRHYIETTEKPQPETFSYVSYATTSEPGGPWTETIPNGTRWPGTRRHHGRSAHCRRVLRITIPCCLNNCENEEFICHLTENTVRKWGAGPLRVWFKQGSLWYKSAYYECCGIKPPPDNGDEEEEWADRFCEAEGHECESCKDWFENKLYTRDPELLKRAYLAMKENPTADNKQEYNNLAMYRRQKWSTQKPQIEETTNILDAFLGDDPTRCVRRGLTVGPSEAGPSRECGFHVKSRDIEIPLPGGKFIGDGYMCSKCNG